MALDEAHLPQPPAVRLGGGLEVGVGIDVEVLLVPVDLVLLHEAGNNLDRPVEGLGLPEVQQEGLPVVDLAVGVPA